MHRSKSVSLSEAEEEILRVSGSAQDPMVRQQAVAIVLGKDGPDGVRSRELLAASYVTATQPSFHLIPRGTAMVTEDEFEERYRYLAAATADFTAVSATVLEEALISNPGSLAPLRMILGLTYNELSIALRLADPDSRTSGSSLKTFERRSAARVDTDRRRRMVRTIATAIVAIMNEEILTVPETAGDRRQSPSKRSVRFFYISSRCTARDGERASKSESTAAARIIRSRTDRGRSRSSAGPPREVRVRRSTWLAGAGNSLTATLCPHMHSRAMSIVDPTVDAAKSAVYYVTVSYYPITHLGYKPI